MTPIERRLDELEEVLIEIATITQDAQRRLSNVVRMGRVQEVDATRGLVKVVWGRNEQGEWAPGVWMAWSTRAGVIKDWNPPSVNEQIMIFSPAGHIGQNSWAMPGGYSNDHKPNHNQSGQRKINVGPDTEILMTADSIVFRTKTFRIQANHIVQNASLIDHNQQGLSADPTTPDAGGTVSNDIPTS